MGTLIYSPDIEVRIESDLHGIVDVSDDIVSGNLSINQGRPHTLSLQLDNPRRKYDGAFMPNDRIVVRLKRLSFLQVFAGYLESVPFASVWPRAVSLTASCSLKRLMYLLYDPGTQAMVYLLNEFITAPDGTSDDGNLTARAKAVLTQVASIREENIHIGALPVEWWSTVSDLYAQVSPFFDASVVDLASGTTGATTNVDGAFVNNDVNDPSIMGPPSVNALQMAAWYRSKGKSDPPFAPIEQVCHWFLTHGMSEGVRGDLAFVHSCWETEWFTNEDSRRFNNFTGIGHYDNAADGWPFASPSQGALAAIQLYKMYAMGNDVPLTNPRADPTNGRILRGPGGGHQTYSALAAVWATDPTLGPKVSAEFQNLLESAGVTMAGLDPNTTTNSSSTTQTTTPPTRDPDAGPRTPSTTTVPPTRDPDAGAAPVSRSFVFPLPPEYQGTYRDNFGDDRSWNRSPDAPDKTHDGIDIMCPVGTPVFAVTDGVIHQAKSTLDNSAGRRITLVDAENNHYKYFHLQTISVNEEDRVRAGQQIGTTGASGTSDASYAPHLHIEWRPDGGEEQNIFPLLTGGVAPSGGSTPSNFISGEFSTAYIQTESTTLAGIRRLMNDGGNNVHNLVKDLFGSAMRSYCSAPNGDIIAWFPDYFDNYGTAGKAVIEDIELIDFTINWSDTGMVTHQFVTGTYEGLHEESNPNDLSLRYNTHGIASIDFPQILEALFGPNAGFWTDPEAIYRRFGARPNSEGITALIRDPGSGSSGEFFYAVHQFMFNWAAMFTASVQVSFMPELWPGMLMQIPSQGLQVYVTQVNHSWNMQSGFTTNAQVIAPSSLDGRFIGLPQAQALAVAGLD